ncbi:MAG: VOC family protein [Acidimicrobiales bacterium]
MAKLDTLTLRVTDPQAQRQFYCDAFGMSDRGDGRVGYSSRETAIRFEIAEGAYVPQPADNYWKIALSVPNIELAWAQLQEAGVSCSEPEQFRDIGYLAHATDPAGFTVELIDHWFEGDRPAAMYDKTLLGGGAHLSLITLRTADIAAIEPDFLRWGMTPLAVQPVEPYGFTLYFYAFTDERPPSANLQAIENRPWLYQRPYSVLEIQHVHDLSVESPPAQGSSGYGGLTISSTDVETISARLGITAAE